MDKLKDLANKVAHSAGGGQSSQQGNQGDEDYLDKAFDKVVDKAGFGGKLNRDQEEKITDGIREGFEKVTHMHVPDKLSN